MADFVADYQALRAAGVARRDIAERLGMRYTALERAYWRAIAAGKLTPDRRAS